MNRAKPTMDKDKLRDLFVAVLLTAGQDVTGNRRGPAEMALVWVESFEWKYIFSFQSVCRVLDRDPARTRKAIRQLYEENEPKRLAYQQKLEEARRNKCA